MTAVTVTPVTAEANRAYVRNLLALRQPGYAAALETAASSVCDDLALCGTGWLHALHRAEVEAAGRRLDDAFAADSVARIRVEIEMALNAATGGAR